VLNLTNLLIFIFKKYFTTFQIICYLLLKMRTLPPTVTEWNQNISPPSPPTVQSQAPLLTCGSCWTAAHGINSSSNSWQPSSHPHTKWFISQLELTVSSTGILERIKNFTIPKSLYNYQAVMYLKKEISISFLIITISASNLYMPMIWSYVILLDFLIPFLCGPDLQ
jgi:hypothetical protein